METPVTAVRINETIASLWPAAPCSCVEVSPERAIARLDPGPEALRPGSFISGPTLFAAADAALYYLAFGATGRITPLTMTSELSIRFLRPAVGSVVRAEAMLNRASRRTVVGTVTVWTDDRRDEPCATAQGTYVLPAE